MPLDISAKQFQELTEQISRLAGDYLLRLDERPIQPSSSGERLVELLGEDAPRRGRGAAVVDRLRSVVEGARVQNGRFLGYVMGSGEPAGATADLLASVLNQNLTAWRSSPSGVTVERTVVRWLAEAIGCREYSGSLTGGGSAANLMGLAMAREAKAPANERGGAAGVVYASEQVHMSIGKAVALLGLGRENLRLVPTDADFRMRVDELERAIARDRADGLVPIAVVASAGTVATGAIDPLARIADVAARERLWMHVDGAYGALAAAVAPERFDGLRRADSVSLDAHKWMYQAVDCGCLLFRDRLAARRAFSHSGDYTRSFTDDPLEGFAFFEESMELSRRFRALRLWTSIQYHGLDAFQDAMRRDLAHARALEERVRRAPDLELLAPVELSAVCFRHRFAESPDARNLELLAAVNRRGRVYLSNATIRGAFALRACFVNHRTTSADVDVVVDEVLAAARAC
ncbi:MAG TPA: pyridoxal-dependent decarboxylase [Anaeromyxobacteraceae bacterium]|nr:pyridoxal-dependent decarboxylase [Anaeromyxobacteraceae bacterium]